MDLPHDTETIDDLSALAWVQDELRRSLEAAHKAMRRYLKEAEASRAVLGGEILAAMGAVDDGPPFRQSATAEPASLGRVECRDTRNGESSRVIAVSADRKSVV